MMTFNLTDRFVLFYNFTVTIYILVLFSSIQNWQLLLATHFLIFLLVFFLANKDRNGASPTIHWLHIWYPILLTLWFYSETGLIRHAIFPEDLDPILLRWETTLFPQRYYFTVPLSLSILTLELLHGAYFSYYLLLFIPGMIAYKNQEADVKKYIFIATVSFFISYWIFILFPSMGPTPLRSEVMPKGVFFIPLMNFLYTLFDKGGGAFPSSHVAVTIIAGWFGSQFFPKFKHIFFGWGAVIILSTVICCYHYTIDTITGIILGFLILIWGQKLYARFNA